MRTERSGRAPTRDSVLEVLHTFPSESHILRPIRKTILGLRIWKAAHDCVLHSKL
jgi:hypothetical protein